MECRFIHGYELDFRPKNRSWWKFGPAFNLHFFGFICESAGTKVNEISRWLSTGRGSWRNVKGSNTIDVVWHFGQTTSFFSWPYSILTMKESFLFLKVTHDSSATSTSGTVPSDSGFSVAGFCFIRFRSSCKPSSKKVKNSCESCC